MTTMITSAVFRSRAVLSKIMSTLPLGFSLEWDLAGFWHPLRSSSSSSSYSLLLSLLLHFLLFLYILPLLYCGSSLRLEFPKAASSGRGSVLRVNGAWVCLSLGQSLVPAPTPSATLPLAATLAGRCRDSHLPGVSELPQAWQSGEKAAVSQRQASLV